MVSKSLISGIVGSVCSYGAILYDGVGRKGNDYGFKRNRQLNKVPS